MGRVGSSRISFSSLGTLSICVGAGLRLTGRSRIAVVGTSNAPVTSDSVSLRTMLQLRGRLGEGRIISTGGLDCNAAAHFDASHFGGLLCSTRSFSCRNRACVIEITAPLAHVSTVMRRLVGVLVVLVNVGVSLIVKSVGVIVFLMGGWAGVGGRSFGVGR